MTATSPGDVEPPLVSVGDHARAARAALPGDVWDYLCAGAGEERTVRANRRAFRSRQLRPRALVDVAQRSTATTVIGREVSAPIAVAPVAYHRLFHPAGELAVARAATSLGLPMTASTFASEPLEAVASARAGSGPLWFQLYVLKDRAVTLELMARAEAAGFDALVVTADAPLMGRRPRDLRNGFALPPGVGPANFAATGPLRELGAPSRGGSALAAASAAVVDASLTWDGLAELRAATRLPLIVKGIMDAGDALRAVDCGVAAIVVSNHGGRQLDSAPATANVLPEVAAAVGDRCEVLVDGGVRSGGDVVKALALGARAVLVGRPVMWGLAAGGEDGARAVLRLLCEELDGDMALCGCPEVAAIGPDTLRSVGRGERQR